MSKEAIKNTTKKSPPKKRKRKRKVNIGKIFAVFVTVCLSLGLMLYPFISNYFSEKHAQSVVNTIEKAADNADVNQYKDELKAAQKYNKVLATGKIKLKDPFDESAEDKEEKEYKSLLNMTDDGVMGFIKIPCIDVSLPIYHGTSEAVLEIGAGHLQGTSLPIGGESTHSVITGHTGLSSAKLFTDLTELEEGDMFFLNVMGEKLAYKIDQITKVLPEEISNLKIENGKDYCTLVTCTPYGVNTHRLLVRGERTDYVEATEDQSNFEVKKTKSQWQEEYIKSIIIASIGFILMIIVLVSVRYILYKKQEKQKRKRKKAPPGKTSKKSKNNHTTQNHSSKTHSINNRSRPKSKNSTKKEP